MSTSIPGQSWIQQLPYTNPYLLAGKRKQRTREEENVIVLQNPKPFYNPSIVTIAFFSFGLGLILARIIKPALILASRILPGVLSLLILRKSGSLLLLRSRNTLCFLSLLLQRYNLLLCFLSRQINHDRVACRSETDTASTQSAIEKLAI
ncbi:hypothetical protein DL95DRAFT_399703, partial [Leptodontidium sp. 2 PMI_412]